MLPEEPDSSAPISFTTGSIEYESDRVVVLDALTYAGNMESLQAATTRPGFRFVKGDIRDQALVESLLRDEQVDTIVHFAAESHVDRSILGPGEFIDTNIVGTYTLLQAARSVWLDGDDAPATHRFHHVSTDEVYGSLSVNDPAFTESTAYDPSSPYSASKAASDHLVRAYHRTYGLQVSISNCSNNYGPFQFPEKLIPLMMINALQGEALPVYGDGSNIRDWLFVDDHVRALDLILRKGKVGETYNIGGNAEHANLDLVRSICELIDERLAEDGTLKKRFPKSAPARGDKTSSLIKMVKDRPGHDWRYAIDSTRAQNELGFHPSCNLEDGLRRTLDWILANESWWKHVMDGSYREWVDKQYG